MSRDVIKTNSHGPTFRRIPLAFIFLAKGQPDLSHRRLLLYLKSKRCIKIWCQIRTRLKEIAKALFTRAKLLKTLVSRYNLGQQNTIKRLARRAGFPHSGQKINYGEKTHKSTSVSPFSLLTGKGNSKSSHNLRHQRLITSSSSANLLTNQPATAA